MRKGDPIAYLHIFDIEPSEAPTSITNVGYEFLRDRLFRANEDVSDGGLAYFRTVKDLQRNFETRDRELTEEWNEFRQKAAADYQDLTRQVTNAQTSVDRVNNAANVVVVFGVFLVSTTVLGFVLAVLVDLIENSTAPWNGAYGLGCNALYGLRRCYSSWSSLGIHGHAYESGRRRAFYP